MFSFRCLPSLASPADSATHSRFAKFLLPSSIYSASKATKDLKKLSFPHAYKVEVESPEKIETLKSMENWVEEKILPILKPVEKSWQPQDFLPDPASDEFPLQVNELRERTKEFPDELFVILAGNMLTEDTLPIFHSFVGSLEPFHDQENETGKGSSRTTAWEIWNNKWSAEENRHGDLLQKYLYLSGRVDMRQLEKTIQYLIGSGTDVGVGGSFYHGTIYTSFQERATFMSYGNIGNLAKQHGDTKLAQICGTIAADEKRHETAYKRIVAKVFEIDPNGMMKAFADMMKNKIKMPGHLMYDGHDVNLFLHFSNVTSRLGVYTIHDYINVLEHLVDIWNVEKLSGLSSEGQAAQDYVCGLPRKLRRMSIVGKTGQAAPTVPFSWIYQREV